MSLFIFAYDTILSHKNTSTLQKTVCKVIRTTKGIYMFKLIFELLTDPLGLPVNDLWEYLILAVIGIIAYSIGWEASPGGLFGSLIHWTVRLLAFFSLWACTYAAISAVQWVIAHWIITICVLVGIALAVYITLAIRQNSSYARLRK